MLTRHAVALGDAHRLNGAMRPRHRISLLVAGAATLTLASTTLVGAQAADVDLASGGNPPAGWVGNPEIYFDKFTGANEGAPQGSVIADSGFRPYPHGFPLPNWGDWTSFMLNSTIWGTPDRLSPAQFDSGNYPSEPEMNALALRRTLGDGVCRDPKAIDPKTGSCDLILGAELLAQSIQTGGVGGHCFGMAAAAAALYNGQISANQVGASGLGINAANPMDARAIQTITRLFGTQYLSPEILPMAKAGQSPTEIIQTLVKELPSGQVPYVLTLIGPGGGHGITPYAVTDRGDGVFDIAVYDNNFPLQAHSVSVDTNDDSFLYTSALNPNSPSYTWSSANTSVLALIPMETILAQQPCPVCRGKDNGTLVAFNAWDAANADEMGYRLIDAQGNPLSKDLFRALGPLNPETEKQVSAPIIAVEPGIEFGVQILTGDLATTQPVEIYAMSNGNSEYLLLDDVPSNSSTIFGVGTDAALVTSNKPSSPRIQQLWDGKKESIDVNGHPLALPAGVIANQDWDRAKKRVVYDSTAKRMLAWNVQVSGVDNEGDVNWVGIKVKVPAGAKIVVDYAKATSTVAPTAWVQAKDGSRTSITMQKVTQSMIEKARDQLYLAQGPS